MLRRWLTRVALLAVFLAPASVRAQDGDKGDRQEGGQKDQAPTIVVRVQSFDALIQNVKVLAKAVDKAEVGEQLESLIKAQTGPNGLEGIDTKKPFGLYAKVGGDLNSMAAVLLVPVNNEKALLKLLENINYKAVKNKDGVYVIQQNELPVDVGFRLANGYAYVTAMNLEAIDKDTLIAPAKIFARDKSALISGSLRMDQIPKAMRDLAIQKLEEELAKEKQKPGRPNETEGERKARLAGIDATGEMMADFLRGGKEISGALTVDATTQMITTHTTISGKKNSQLHASIVKLAKTNSPFAALHSKGAAVNTSINFPLPGKISKAFGEAFEEGFKKSLDKETNEQKRKQAELFLKAIEPSLKAGEITGALTMKVGKGDKEGNVTLVAGFKLKEGGNLEETLKKLVAEAPAGDREKVKWNVAKAGDVNIHRIDAQDGYDKETKKLFGKSPIYFAIRDDALFVAVGKGHKQGLEHALAAKPGPAPVLFLEADVGQLAHLSNKEHERAAAEKVFGKGEKGIIRFTVEGGESLRIRFEMSLSVLAYGVAVSNRTKEVRLDAPGQ